MDHVKARLAVAAVCLWLAGCGGGGGTAGTDSSAPPPAVGAKDPTLVLSPPGSSAGFPAQRLATMTMSAGSHAQNLALLVVDLVHRQRAPGSQRTVQARCAVSGSLTLTLDDRDSDGRSSAGDVLKATFDRCGVPVMQRLLDGALEVEIQAATDPALEGSFRALLRLIGSLRIDSTGFRPDQTWSPQTLAGSLNLAWTVGEARTRLDVSSSARDDLRFAGDSVQGWTPIGVLDMRRIAIVKDTRFDEARIDQALAFDLVFSSGSRAVVSSPTPMEFALSGDRTGRVTVRGADGATIQIGHPGNPFLLGWAAELLTAGGARMDLNVVSDEGVHPTLSWDGRSPVGGRYGRTRCMRCVDVELPGDGESLARLADLRDLFARRADFNPATDSIDPVFVQPVLPTPPTASVDATFRVQATLPVAPIATPLHWRFRDVLSSDTPYPITAWNVGARGVQTGALFKVQPLEPLRYGQTYELQVSADGRDWSRVVDLPLAAGGSLSAPSTLASLVQAGALLLLDIGAAESAIPAASHPASLSATATTTGGAAVTRWQWTQLDGAPVIFDKPDAPQTLVRFAGAAARPFELATLQLKAVDSLGRSQRSRIVMRVGNVRPSGALHYHVTRLSTLGYDIRQMEFGAGSVLPLSGSFGHPAGSFNMRVSGPAEAGSGLALRMPNGIPLATGEFVGATSQPVQAGKAMLGCYRTGCGSGATGQFKILEAESAADGTVLRLAVDYDQVVLEPDMRFDVRGSYRFNSAIPIRP